MYKRGNRKVSRSNPIHTKLQDKRMRSRITSSDVESVPGKHQICNLLENEETAKATAQGREAADENWRDAQAVCDLHP